MRSLRLKNFRSLVDTGRIELRPLTLLVGANSSGKSSFLRFFPLLRQTFEAKSASPLLWYGRYVDFGDFSQAVRRGAEPREVTIEFETATSGYVNMASSATLREHEGKTQATEWRLSCEENALSMTFDSSGAPSNLTIFAREKQLHVVTSPLLGPYTIRGSLLPHSIQQSIQPSVRSLDTGKPVLPLIKNPWALLRAEVSRGFGDELSEVAKDRLSRLLYRDAERMLIDLEEDPEYEILRQRFAKDREYFERVRSYAFAATVPFMLDGIAESLEAYGLGCVYIGPIRSAPERFYRLQELSVSQIEPHGENLAMFLRALSREELGGFSAFASEHIGFHVVLKAEGGHIAVLLEDDLGQAFNLIDMGYGFSQILPVIAQCWATATGRRASKQDPLPTVIAIEQPELHLHPSYQAKLADMFVGTMNAVRNVSEQKSYEWILRGAQYLGPPQLIIETHSEPLLIRLGEMVEAGQLASEDVSVLLFEQDPVTKTTTIRQSQYSADGALTNWPLGFFAP